MKNEFEIAEIEALWLSRIKLWDTHFTSIFSGFSEITGWIADVFHAVLSLNCYATDRT